MGKLLWKSKKKDWNFTAFSHGQILMYIYDLIVVYECGYNYVFFKLVQES